MAIDEERDCRQLVPAAYSAPVLSEDNGSRIFLDTIVLLDGVSRREAAALVKEAQVSYTPLTIKIRPTFRRLRGIPSDGSYGGRPAAETSALFKAARDAVGGKRPAGSDIVVLLSEKSFYGFTDEDGDGYPDENERQYGTIGEAACAGGVRWPETAFALVDARFSSDPKTVGITLAHEIGHLLGGHHHLANCTEGVQEAPATPCTTMWAFSMAISSTFGRVNAAIIRGHSVTYAAP